MSEKQVLLYQDLFSSLKKSIDNQGMQIFTLCFLSLFDQYRAFCKVATFKNDAVVLSFMLSFFVCFISDSRKVFRNGQCHDAAEKNG